ncbi:MAG TPA: S9 family peptidase [Blastocatellia bacterium]|nr:S9 family peptidase [Blastocatellia bacterium]
MRKRVASSIAALIIFAVTAQAGRPASPDDIFVIKDVGEARISPGGAMVAYTVTSINREKNNYISRIYIRQMNASDGAPIDDVIANDSMPRWSPDGKKIAFASNRSGNLALWFYDVEARKASRITGWERSNHFLSKAGESLAWSPDSKWIAFVAAERPKEPPPTDPRVISRIQYKSRTGFSDNLRSHIFIASIDLGGVLQLTRGDYDEHSISWSPDGKEIAFLSNRERDPDANFNYDIFTVDVASGRERRLTSTPGVEFSPVWTPDGKQIAYTATKRALTTIDSIAEDTHVWIISRAGGAGRELTASFDRRASSPQLSAPGHFIYFLAGDRGRTLIYKVAPSGGKVSPVFERQCQVGSFSVSIDDKLAFTLSDQMTPAELYTTGGPGELRRLTSINAEMAAGLSLVEPENVRFKSFDGVEVEGWLMRPLNFQAGKKYPLVLFIHGGPHGMYGYGFNHSNQVYAARGYAVLYLNPRGSNGYGQKFSDGCVNNWGGGDYQDLMKGVDHVLAKYDWVDANRLGVTGGSYGGFMTNWVVTQTTRFKAAIAVASLSNLISFYSTSLYQDLIHVEFKGFPWDNYDLLWKYSPLRYVKNVQTPTLLIHGEQDMDVHITQAEEMYTALKQRGVESVLVRYPREGHGLREPAHRLDYMNRSLAWFDRFLRPNGE